MWALIINDTVVETTDIDPEGRFHPDMDWRPCAENVRQGWRVEDGELLPPPVAPVDLTALKAVLKTAIDDAAERERLKYITPGAGQAMTYARKVEQAKAVLAATDPQPEAYLMLAASIGIDGDDLIAVAQTIIAMDAAWEVIGGAIEAARLAAKRDIDLAEDADAARGVAPAWPFA